eukprot:10784524-Alexandrium_andersonii.AAC.1
MRARRSCVRTGEAKMRERARPRDFSPVGGRDWPRAFPRLRPSSQGENRPDDHSPVDRDWPWVVPRLSRSIGSQI